MANCAELAKGVEEYFDEIVTIAEKGVKSGDDESIDVDIKEMEDYLKSCDMALSPTIKKLLRAKGADVVKYAKKIIGITDIYIFSLKKLKAEQAKMYGKNALKPKLKAIKIACENIVKNGIADQEGLKEILEQQKKWSKTKAGVIQVLKRELARTNKAKLAHLDTFASDIKLIKKPSHGELIKRIAAYGKVSLDKKSAALKDVIKRLEDATNDVKSFQVSDTGISFANSHCQDALKYFRIVKSELQNH